MNNYFTNITTHLKLKPTKIDPKANLEKQLGNGKKVGVIFMDLSKVFDTINVIDQCDFSYLCNRLQRSIINGSFSSCNEVII